MFGVAVLLLLSSIMIVIGRIVLHKQRSQQTSAAEAESRDGASDAAVGAITKLQVADAITSVTTIAEESNENSSEDVDLTTPITIPSISSRNNVRLCLRAPRGRLPMTQCGFLSFQHLYNTYTPSSYGNLDPSSISYALVPPNLYSSNLAMHAGLVGPAARYSHPMHAPNQPNLSMC